MSYNQTAPEELQVVSFHVTCTKKAPVNQYAMSGLSMDTDLTRPCTFSNYVVWLSPNHWLQPGDCITLMAYYNNKYRCMTKDYYL